MLGKMLIKVFIMIPGKRLVEIKYIFINILISQTTSQQSIWAAG
jgi:hypothetical protein